MLNNFWLGFDFGLRHIGVAVGQDITGTASPLPILKAQHGVPNWREVQKFVDNWHPSALIVGIPVNMDGSEHEITHHARQFAAALQKQFGLPVYGVDERLSTKEARQRIFAEGGYRALQKLPIDSFAAQLILETWLKQNAKTDPFI